MTWTFLINVAISTITHADDSVLVRDIRPGKLSLQLILPFKTLEVTDGQTTCVLEDGKTGALTSGENTFYFILVETAKPFGSEKFLLYMINEKLLVATIRCRIPENLELTLGKFKEIFRGTLEISER